MVSTISTSRRNVVEKRTKTWIAKELPPLQRARDESERREKKKLKQDQTRKVEHPKSAVEVAEELFAIAVSKSTT